MSLQTSNPATQLNSATPVWSGAGQNYLDCVQNLVDELDLAMNAIASCELRTFEESVDRQRFLSTRLQTLTVSAASTVPTDPPTLSEENLSLDQRIGAALGRLQGLNRRYAALIKQSSEMAKELTYLLNPPAGYMRGGEVAPTSYSTWSCQL